MERKIRRFLSMIISAIIISVSFCGFTNAHAENKYLELEDVSIMDQSATIVAEDPAIVDNKITGSITFNELNDYITYKLSFKNIGSSQIKLTSITDNNTSEYINLEYHYDNDCISTGDTITATITIASEQQDHHDREAHFRAGGNTEHKGSCNRICEKGLQKETGESERAAEDHRRADPRQTDAADDHRISLIPEDHVHDLPRGYGDAPGANVDHDKKEKRRQKDRKAGPQPGISRPFTYAFSPCLVRCLIHSLYSASSLCR